MQRPVSARESVTNSSVRNPTVGSGWPTHQPVTEGQATYEVQVDVDRIRVRSVRNQASGSTPV